ncbi:MAG: hypothetical protein KF784_03690 [Fimbriimonadaceae bacterium]|nr:hypothetical protein [Fimbriimonadaceae bacterium]
MPVQNIECQIAQGQISRYLSGDSFPTAVVTELEKHIAECPNCQEIVNQKKSMLQAMLRLQGAPAAKAVVEVLEDEEEAEVKVSEVTRQPKPSRQTLSQKLIDRIAQAHEEQEKQVSTKREAFDKKKFFGKPLMYSLALAAVLVAMSYVMKDPTRLFGDRVVASSSSAALDQTPPPVAAPEEDTTGTTVEPEILGNTVSSVTDSIANAASAALATQTLPEQPATEPPTTEAPPKTVEPAAAKPTTATPTPARKTQKRIPQRKPSSSGIRVYDKDGNPIK